MNRNFEDILMTSLAAYGLMKILEGLFARPARQVVVVQAPAQFLEDLLADADEVQE